MKNFFYLFIFSFLSIMTISSCKEKVSKSGPEYTSAYVCPMHCEGSGSDQPGKCPVCKMDYKKNEQLNSEESPSDKENSHEGHNHEGHDHEGHNHDGHDHSGHDHHDHEGHSH